MAGTEYNSTSVLHIRGDQGTEMVNQINIATASNGHAHIIDIDNIGSANQPRYPSSDHLLKDDGNAREKYLSLGVTLYKAALRGDWDTAKGILNRDRSLLTASISKGGQTVLHLAAGTKHIHFVKELVEMMDKKELEVQDLKGNTAFCFAVWSETEKAVAEIMLQKNENLATIRGGKGMTPLYMAAMFGRSEMASCLYSKKRVVDSFEEKDRNGIFFTCINTGLYDLALKILKVHPSLATERDKDSKTALHLLAQTPSAFDNESPKGWSKLLNSYFDFGFKRNSKQSQALELVRFLWNHVLHLGHDTTMDLIKDPTELLFDATKLGNFEFLAELISSYPDLLWETNDENQSIIHVAVLNRHANIFNLIHEIGSIKDLLATYQDEDGNNILHLAAKLAPLERLNIVSGAALQMQQELLWFEEVKKHVQPPYKKEKNKVGKRPEELFIAEHKNLLKDGEVWMKKTAESCTFVATLIATVVFAAAFTLPGAHNSDGTPMHLQNTSFLIFVLSDGFALLNSIVALVVFLSILISRYREYDFLKRLPLKLMIGLTTLFFSMIAMMIAFSFTFIIAYHHGLKWVPLLISMLAIVPIALFAILKFPLVLDIFSSTYCSGTLFQPSRHMLD